MGHAREGIRTGNGPRRLARDACCVVAAGLSLAFLVVASGSGALLASAPFLQQGGKLTGGGETGDARFGSSVALSADGSTALVGGRRDSSDKGAAWVFTRSGATWTQQADKLTGSAANSGTQFGFSVALAANGSTALVGGRDDDGSNGAAWVFTRSGSAWSQQVGKL